MAQDVADQITKAYADIVKIEKLTDEEIAALRDQQISDIIDTIDFDGWSVLFDKAQPILEDVAKYGGARALGQVEISDIDITNMVNDDAVAWSRFRAAQMVGKKWIGGELVDNPNPKWAITDSTRSYIRSSVTDAVNEGWSTRELAQSIKDNLAFSDDRADLIARTEVNNAEIQGRMMGYKDSGVVEGKQWIVSDSHDDDDECDANEQAGVIPFDEPFPSGDDAPLAHPRCLCDVIPVVMLESEAD